jgi:hypothetical protein
MIIEIPDTQIREAAEAAREVMPDGAEHSPEAVEAALREYLAEAVTSVFLDNADSYMSEAPENRPPAISRGLARCH